MKNKHIFANSQAKLGGLLCFVSIGMLIVGFMRGKKMGRTCINSTILKIFT